MTSANRALGQLAAAAATAAALLSLVACGGENINTDTGAGTSTVGKQRPNDEARESAPSAVPPDNRDGSAETNQNPGGDNSAGQKQSHSKAASMPTKGRQTEDHASLPQKKQQTETSGCPAQISRKQCGEIAAAAEEEPKSSTEPTQGSKCPSSLSEEECAALVGSAGKGTGSNPAEECPPAFSVAQCRALEEALYR
jgi:hypothetical protein